MYSGKDKEYLLNVLLTSIYFIYFNFYKNNITNNYKKFWYIN